MRVVLILLVISQFSFAQDINRGEEIFQKKCISCHGKNAQGIKSQKAPRLAGQYDWYTISSLKKFVSGERKNAVMLPYIKGLTEQDFKDIAAYLEGLK